MHATENAPTQERFAQLMEAVDTDFATAFERRPDVSVVQRATGLWLVKEHRESLDDAAAAFDADAPFVAFVGNNAFTVEEAEFPALAVAIVEALQEIVMGEQNHGWPERVDPDGTFSGFAEPVLRASGEFGWGIRDEPLIPFGRLPAAMKTSHG